jgi:hypothetical protein
MATEVAVLIGAITVLASAWLARELVWLRRVRRASGDPEQLTRLMTPRRFPHGRRIRR